jgi:hypothetical protein
MTTPGATLCMVFELMWFVNKVMQSQYLFKYSITGHVMWPVGLHCSRYGVLFLPNTYCDCPRAISSTRTKAYHANFVTKFRSKLKARI